MTAVERHIRKVTTKGQVTIPAAVRELLGIAPHDQVVFRVEEGRVELRPAEMSLEDAYGSVGPLSQPEDFARLRQVAIEEKVAREAEDEDR